MTDDKLDELIHDAYYDVEISPEAEDRILANLLAAEADPVKGTGDLTGFSVVEGEGNGRAGKPVKTPVPLTGSKWIAVAASLLLVAIIGVNLIPAFSPSNDAAPESKMAEETSYDTGGMVAESAPSEEAASGIAYDTELFVADTAEVVVLEDGSRYTIADLYEVPEDLDPGELDWQPAVIEETGDTCDVALLEDGTALVLFEGEGDLFLALPAE